MEKIVFSRPLSEVGCIIGHLFHGMEPPCDATRCGEDWLTICFSEEGTMRHHYLGTGICSTELDIEGPTKGGGSAKLKIKRDTCEFYGDRQSFRRSWTEDARTGGAAMPEYVLGNKAKELYRYTKEVTQPVPDDTVKADDVSKVMRMIARANTLEEMRGTLYATADRLDNRKKRPRFPKSESFGMIKDLRDAARIAMRSIHAANDTNFKEHPMDRLTEIKRTIDECNLLLQLVELAHDLGYIDKKRMGTWTSKITDVKRMSLSWLKKDGARAASIKDGQDRQQLERLVALVREIMEKEAAAKDQEDQEDQENQEDTPPQ